MTSQPKTLGELRSSSNWSEQRLANRSLRQELRENLLCRMEKGETLFPGVHGYDDTVIPQIINAILSRHHFILLGLRGQAKSRILRGLVGFMDAQVPVVAGCEINDNPYRPICRACRERIASEGDSTAIAWLSRDHRYVEKLATPDVTIADMIGDVDPIKAARGGRNLSDELTIHYGLLPRANRGIFAINELPDLAGKIQVGLFNIMQEGDVQIKGYPVRLPLDVAMVFSANPEDYTARGKIITPLKDRIGSEIRTHYPATVDEAIAITSQEAWTERDGYQLQLPDFVRQVIEHIAFIAREDKRIDKRSGVSQRLPISVTENVISNAERRAIRSGEKLVVPRIGDIYAAMPAMTGKLELEYEGELKGADNVVRELIRAAVARAYDKYFQGNSNMNQVVQWFDLGGEIQLRDSSSAQEMLHKLRGIQGLLDKLSGLGLSGKEPSEVLVSGAEFILEGLYAHKKIGRSEERTFTAGEKQPRREKQNFREEEDEREVRRQRRPFN
jgi:magnesium chelatase subunit I